MAKKVSALSSSTSIQNTDSLILSDSIKNYGHYVQAIEKNPFFKKLLEILPCRISITDYQAQKYLYINETSGEGLTGYTVNEFMEHGILFFMNQVHPDDMQEITNHLFPKLVTSMEKHSVEEIKQFKFSFTYRFKRKDNIWVNFLQNYVILEMDEGKGPLLLLNFVSDITPFKKDNEVMFNLSHYGNKSGIMDMIPWNLNGNSKTSERENEIIRFIAHGTKTKEIAIKLNLSEYTVRAHKRNIFTKTETNNIAQLTSYAFANGII